MASLSRRLSAAGAAASVGRAQLRRPAGVSGLRYSYCVRRPMRLVAAGDTVGGGAWVTFASGGREEKVGACSYAVEDRKVAVDGGRESVEGSGKRAAEVAAAAAATVVLGVGNRVLYKLALVPLKQYPFFLAQLATFGLRLLVLVYWRLLLLQLEWLQETFLVWQILLSIIFLGRRYKVNQLLGCFLVSIGVVVTVASGAGAGNSLKEGGMFWSLLMIISFFLQAAGTVLKETIFLDSTQKLKYHLKQGGSMDLFVVNSYGSAFQALFICLLLPFLSKLWGIPFSQLPNYLKDGAACFLNVGTLSSGCDGAPLLPLLFIIVNIGFNIALLHLLKISSAVVSCLASTFSVPISIYVFTMPLPYLGVASSLPTGFMAGAIILLLGLLIYAWTPSNGSFSAST
ncbi:protein CLT3, chloroplastic-like isoform X3 [Vigna unguiculata]|uniref:protein CLT3, chloroplastic-like isoform X3 n=1 Tax=Vigna unguiculata TaxID=3917 RepID=UPI001015D29B|nr:protein CLT3, chloroplastic-like isoform X3 [Vigna unguiculata]